MLTGPFNYALGGAGGGFVAGSHDLIAWLRQKSRPYLMSSALSPYAVLIASEALKLVDKEARLRARLLENVKALKSRLEEGGLTVRGGEHAILSVVVGDAVRAQQIITALYEAGIYAVGHCHPIVAEGDARVRFQVSAKHTKSALDRTVTTMLEACAKYSL
ncbi:MAG: aminotransferase class I/II-fold pyridoxal phosphate-dependent enzyme [Myxococcota bacterium]